MVISWAAWRLFSPVISASRAAAAGSMLPPCFFTTSRLSLSTTHFPSLCSAMLVTALGIAGRQQTKYERGAKKAVPNMERSLDRWLAEAPSLDCDWDPLKRTYRRSLVDLAALRFSPLSLPGHHLSAAGLPWFMTMFGRDSIFTSLQALPFAPDLARTTLVALGLWQGVRIEYLPQAHLERPFLVTESASPTEARLKLTVEVFAGGHSNEQELHPWDRSILGRFQNSATSKPYPKALSVRMILRDPGSGGAAFSRSVPVEALAGRNWIRESLVIPNPPYADRTGAGASSSSRSR